MYELYSRVFLFGSEYYFGIFEIEILVPLLILLKALFQIGISLHFNVFLFLFFFLFYIYLLEN